MYMYKAFIYRNNGIYINSFHCSYCVISSVPHTPSIRKPAPWNLLKKMWLIPGVEYSMLSAKTTKVLSCSHCPRGQALWGAGGLLSASGESSYNHSRLKPFLGPGLKVCQEVMQEHM